MCGIVGKVNFDRQPVDPDQIRRMADSVRHRGPDDEGVWTGDGVGLGHRRLSIIDLSASGRNPMCNEDETIWIVFNGEIYNFQELRPQLEASGHKFRSHTDTEVILHLYEDHGAACVEQLRGMFAFAIWDRRARQLLLARDRLGVKPLYYQEDASGLRFGSEIKAILSDEEVEAIPDSGSIHDFLVWQCIPGPRTGFQGIRKLPPASILTWQTGAEVTIQKYWELDCAQPRQQSSDELACEVSALVQEATRIRLVADVPVGIFLSGGIDSACILAAARVANSGPLRTFSVTFGNNAFDESRFARRLAQHFETEHSEFEVNADVVRDLPRVTALFDEPFADIAAIPTWHLARLTRDHVTVALSGDGGDEAFGGYHRYLALKGLGLAAQFGGAKWLPKLQSLLPRRSADRSRLRYLRELLGISGKSPEQQYRALFLGMFDGEQWVDLYTDDFRTIASEANPEGLLPPWNSLQGVDDLARAMASDTLYYIPECLNVKVDICSMACGLEVRSPFLDHKLVEFCARIPTSQKLSGFDQKHILKHAFRDELPREILGRGKAGFGLPLAEWIRGPLRDLTYDTLLAPAASVHSMVRPAAIRKILEEHMEGTRNWHVQIWRLLVLEIWLQAHLRYAAASPHLEPAIAGRVPVANWS
jgi:asparagine synthase (glutamine-hydrolysing)